MIDVRELSVRFGGVTAVDRVDVALDAGELLGVVGPNGSGKSTLLNALSGVVAATGSVTVGGASLRLGSVRSSYEAGLLRVFQAPQMFAGLTVLENVMAGVADKAATGIIGATALRPAMWAHERARLGVAMEQLDRVGLRAEAGLQTAELPYGKQRLVELARALAASPRVLLLDEPSAGLNDQETADLGELLGDLHGTGLSMLLVDHKIDFIDRLADRVLVLELGRKVADGSPATIWSNQHVIDAYLGVADHA